MGEVVNLRRARKAKERSDREAVAASNRVSSGRSKAEKRETALRNERSARSLDGHRREPSADDA